MAKRFTVADFLIRYVFALIALGLVAVVLRPRITHFQTGLHLLRER